MKIFSSLQTEADISLTWGKGKNSRKWKDLVQKSYGDKLGDFLRFASTTFGGDQYLLHVYENAAFLIKETSSKGGSVTHFGFGDFKGTKSLRWKMKGDKVTSNKGHELSALGSISSVKTLMDKYKGDSEQEQQQGGLVNDPDNVPNPYVFILHISQAEGYPFLYSKGTNEWHDFWKSKGEKFKKADYDDAAHRAQELLEKNGLYSELDIKKRADCKLIVPYDKEADSGSPAGKETIKNKVNSLLSKANDIGASIAG